MSLRPAPPPLHPSLSQGAFEMQKPAGVHLSAIGAGWALVRKELLLWIVASGITGCATVAMGVLCAWVATGEVLSGDGTFPANLRGLQGASLGFLSGVISVTLFLGMVHMAKEQALTGKARLCHLFAGFRRIGAIAVTLLICSVMVYVGLLLAVLPGIWVAGMLGLALPLVVEQELGPWEAVMESFRRLKNHAPAMAGFLFCCGLLLGLSFSCYFVGLLFAVPSVAAALGLHYLFFYPPGSPARRGVFMSPTGVESTP